VTRRGRRFVGKRRGDGRRGGRRDFGLSVDGGWDERGRGGDSWEERRGRWWKGDVVGFGRGRRGQITGGR